jgi:hypothetical protein
VAYVGWLRRHAPWAQNVNVIPYGARFLPGNADPSNPALPLNDNFFRPYPGYGNITVYSNNGTSNYNGLQVAVNRRFARGLSYGVSLHLVQVDELGGHRYGPCPHLSPGARLELRESRL